MRKTTTAFVLCALATTLFAVPALSADKPKYGGLSGIVASVDVQAKTMMVKQKDGSETLAGIRESRTYELAVGSVDDLVEGRPVEVSGKIADDNSSVQARQVIVYTGKGRGSSRILSNRKRVDGTLVKTGDGWAVKYNKGQMDVQLPAKPRIQTRAPLAIDKIQAGDMVSMYGQVHPDKFMPSFTCVVPKKD